MGKTLHFISVLSVLLSLLPAGASAQSDFERTVAERGYAPVVADLSDFERICIDEPRLALVNFTGFSSMPDRKTTTVKGYMEVYDGNGVYFRKPVALSGQGGYTIRFPKKNFVCHFTDAQWNEDGGAELKIGQWVGQDAFHFKAFYTDFTRGLGEVGYKLFSQMVADRRPYWERGGYYRNSAARCFPDGFPCAVYLGGRFYGIFAWQLKKHRKNMNQLKDCDAHIHLDGNLRDDYIFRGKISWSQFEVRTPRKLYGYRGAVYNGNYPCELIDETSDSYDLPADPADVRAAKQLSAKVKRHIVDMSRYWDELRAMEQDGADTAAMRREIERRYDIEALIDYAVHYYFTRNGDGTLKNWQWFTYDGRRWAVTPYDLDQTFGIGLYGNIEPPHRPLDRLTSGPFYWTDRYYADDIARRYAQLRAARVLDYANVTALIDDWCGRVGSDLYLQEEQRWADSPCYSDARCNPGWESVGLDDPEYWLSGQGNYDPNHTYQAGDVCWLEGRLWRATATVRAVRPFLVNANRDSMERLCSWVQGRIDFLDACFAYDDGAQRVDNTVLDSSGNRRLQAIYTLGGLRVDAPTPGRTYIFRYTDGTSRKIVVR